MSQPKVDKYFSLRKRPNTDDGVSSKEKRLKSVDDPAVGRTTRSRAKKAEEEPAVVQQPTITLPPVVVQQSLEDATNKPSRKQKLSAEELKAKMQNFSQKLQKHKEKYAAKQGVSEERQAEIQIESMQKVQDQINKICEKPEVVVAEVEPAYSKYANLATVDAEQKFVLPAKFNCLFELFKGSDTVVKFIYNRQEVCTFLKLKSAVQNMTKKNFSQNNLGQFKTVYPTAYIFKQEKLFIDFKNDYHLTIQPNFEKEEAPANENGVRVISPLMLLRRLEKFKNSLFDIVKESHQKFLKSIGVVMDTKKVKKWHPKFDLEAIDDIVAAELPQKPNELKVTTGEDLKKIASEVYSTRVKTAIDIVLQKQETVVKEVVSVASQTPATLKEKQQSNYNAILERVRAKERHKDIENMVMNSDKEKRLQLLEKYTECVRFVKSYFNAEKKATIDLETVCKKMHESLKVHTANDCEDIVKEGLCKDFANWISIIKVRQQQYVKIDKSIELNELLTKITSMMETVKA